MTDMAWRTINCQLNRVNRTLEVEDSTFLLDFVRDLGLTGAKPSCELEVCGACTVLLDGLPVSACTTLAVEADGKSIETIEGLVRDGELHPLQEAFLEHFAFQCGFCTPGMIMSAKALLEDNPSPTRGEVVHWMEGNICRCTGYESIIDAVMAAAEQQGRKS
jgi:aerobic-type carbon monoxide dehydrogenase small subunit (CoxS/CutS family)